MLLFDTIRSFMRDPDYRSLLLTTAIVLGIGTVSYHHIEGWSILDSLYFSFITLTTIGYGDFSPATDWGKVFTMFYIIIGIGIILAFVNTVYRHYEDKRVERKQKNSGNGPSSK